MSLVVCKLPKAGLGNQLFPLMKASVFSYLNKLPLLVIDYHQFKMGPYLRREKTKRNYNLFFSFQKNIWSAWLDKVKVSLMRFPVVTEAPVKQIENVSSTTYLFDKIPHWSNFFDQLRDHRMLVIDLFWKMLRKNVTEQIELLRAPVIGVHIRMGDFRKLVASEDFNKVGSVRTPEQYFFDIICRIRKIHGSDLDASVFTDGYKKEFQTLFSLPNISLVEGNSDMVDLLLLSKSKVIIVSAGSTFGYWAGFLSDSPIILHPGHIHQPIRGNSSTYEGPMNEQDELLVRSIKSIKMTH